MLTLLMVLVIRLGGDDASQKWENFATGRLEQRGSCLEGGREEGPAPQKGGSTGGGVGFFFFPSCFHSAVI